MTETARVERCENWKGKVGSKLKMRVEGEWISAEALILAQCPIKAAVALDGEKFYALEFGFDGRFSEGFAYEGFPEAFEKFKEIIW